MKKLIVLLTAILLFASFGVIAYAGNTYDVPELKMSITAPDDWYVITRNPEDNSQAEKFLGIASNDLMDHMEQNLIYINFLSPSGFEEIVVTMVETDDSHDLVSINQLTDRQLEEIAETMMGMTMEDLEQTAEDISYEGLMPNEAQWTGYGVYEHEQATFMKLYHTKALNGIQFEGLQYYTVQNGLMINVTLTAYAGEIDESLETIIKDTVDSIVFTEIAEGKTSGIDYGKAMRQGVITGVTAMVAFGLISLIGNKKKKQKQANPPESAFPDNDEAE